MRRGVLYAVGAYLLWGLFPMYWPLLEPAGAVEILAHRMLWSAVVMTLALTAMWQWRKVRALGARTWGLIFIAAVLITVNWGVYIFAVNNGHVLEASLGYFINPLVAVALGVIALRERLRPLQWVALAIAVVGVILSSLGAQGFPYIAMTLAMTFGLYGLIKRIIHIPAAISLFGESAMLVLPALGFLLYLQYDDRGHFFGYGAGHIALTVGAGVVTAVPLLMFGAAALRLPLSLLGFIQYVNPLTQFLLGVLWAHEVMTPSRWAGFVVIWLALTVMSYDAIGRTRAAHHRRRDTMAAGGSDGLTGQTPVVDG